MSDSFQSYVFSVNSETKAGGVAKSVTDWMIGAGVMSRDVFDNVLVARTAAPCRPVVLTIGPIAMVQIRAYGEEAIAGKTLGHLFHELIHAVLMLDHEDSRQRPVALWTGDEEIHRAGVDNNFFALCLHSFLPTQSMIGEYFRLASNLSIAKSQMSF